MFQIILVKCLLKMITQDTPTKRLKGWQYVLAGGGSGAMTRAICQPLDVLKIRFQIQVEPIAIGSKYSSMYQAVRIILKDEGVTALWSGHVPAQFLSISYGFVQFWCYETLSAKCYTFSNASFVNKASVDFSCGAIAGSLATVASFPFDTIRTRMIAEDKNSPVYKGVLHVYDHMCKTEGRLSLYRGLLPTIAQIAPHAGAQFMFYKIFSDYFKSFNSDNNKSKMSVLNSLTSGSIAGFLSKLFIYPFDVAKKRLQIQGFKADRTYFGKNFVCTGFFDCIIKTVKYEGFRALYKGLFPSLVKASVVSSLHFVFFEQFCNAFRCLNCHMKKIQNTE